MKRNVRYLFSLCSFYIFLLLLDDEYIGLIHSFENHLRPPYCSRIKENSSDLILNLIVLLFAGFHNPPHPPPPPPLRISGGGYPPTIFANAMETCHQGLLIVGSVVGSVTPYLGGLVILTLLDISKTFLG